MSSNLANCRAKILSESNQNKKRSSGSLRINCLQVLPEAVVQFYIIP